MKDLPNKFQMRVKKYPGFTHTVKRNGWGDYKVTWARGFERIYNSEFSDLPTKIFDEGSVLTHLGIGSWQIVDNKSKQKEELPDEFWFEYDGLVYHAKVDKNTVECSWKNHPYIGYESGKSDYPLKAVAGYIKDGTWTIINKPTLTTEQQRQLKDFKEQVAQLEQSIKLNQQDISHKERLVANYEQRKSDVLKKIVELEGM